MSEGKNSEPSPAGPFWQGLLVLSLSTLLGFAAVYFTLGRPDNAAIPDKQANPALAEPQSSSAAKPAAKTGQMAAFVKKKAPAAVADITFNDGAGKERKLSDFKGKTILLNLWATWCAPCREEMPSLDRLQMALGSDKFEVVALSLDRKGAEASKKFLDEVKATNLKLYIDATAKQGTALGLVGMPTTLLIDADGKELGRLTGPAVWDSEEAKKLIEAALK